jgi:hypothetical protein
VILAAYDHEVDLGPLEAAIRSIDPTLAFEQRLVEATELVQRRVVGVWQLVSKLGTILDHRGKGPLDESMALREIFVAERDRLTVEPAAAARMLRAFTLSLTHPMIATEPMPAGEIVAVFLHGIMRSDTNR